jgi:hypothetical protein
MRQLRRCRRRTNARKSQRSKLGWQPVAGANDAIECPLFAPSSLHDESVRFVVVPFTLFGNSIAIQISSQRIRYKLTKFTIDHCYLSVTCVLFYFFSLVGMDWSLSGAGSPTGDSPVTPLVAGKLEAGGGLFGFGKRGNEFRIVKLDVGAQGGLFCGGVIRKDGRKMCIHPGCVKLGCIGRTRRTWSCWLEISFSSRRLPSKRRRWQCTWSRPCPLKRWEIWWTDTWKKYDRSTAGTPCSGV